MDLRYYKSDEWDALGTTPEGRAKQKLIQQARKKSGKKGYRAHQKNGAAKKSHSHKQSNKWKSQVGQLKRQVAELKAAKEAAEGAVNDQTEQTSNGTNRNLVRES